MQQFHELAPEEQLLTKLLGTLYAPVPVTRLLMYLEACSRCPYDLGELRQRLQRLLDVGVLHVIAGRYGCDPTVAETALRAAAEAGQLEAMIYAIELCSEGRTELSWHSREGKHALQRAYTDDRRDLFCRELRVAIYLRDEPSYQKLIKKDDNRAEITAVYERICLAFDASWFSQLPPSMQNHIWTTLNDSNHHIVTGLLEWRERQLLACVGGDERDRTHLAWRAICQGRLKVAAELVQTAETPEFLAIRAALQMVQGRPKIAALEFARAIAERRKLKGSKDFVEEFLLLHVVALLADNRYVEVENALKPILRDPSHPLRAGALVLEATLALQRGQILEPAELPYHSNGSRLSMLLRAAYQVWRAPAKANQLVVSLQASCNEAQKSGFQWLAAEYAQLLARATGTEACKQRARKLHQDCGTTTFMDLIGETSLWEHQLRLLEMVVGPTQAETPPPPRFDRRMIWLVECYGSPEKGWTATITPREQKLSAKGTGWTVGRPVSVERLRHGLKEFPYMNEADRRICQCVKSEIQGNYWTTTIYSIDSQKALPLLVGHPLVFHESEPDRTLEVRADRPVLRGELVGDLVVVTLCPSPPGDHSICALPPADGMLKFFEFKPVHFKLRKILSGGCAIPHSGQSKLQQLFRSLSTQMEVEWNAPEIASPLDLLAESLARSLSGAG